MATEIERLALENERFREQVETLKAANAPLDRAVNKQVQENKELKGRIAELETGGNPAPAGDPPKPELSERESALAERESLISLAEKAIDRGLDPARARTLFDNRLTVEERLDSLVDYSDDLKQQTTDRILKENGRNPVSGIKLDMTPKTVQDLIDRPHLQDTLSPEAIGDIMLNSTKPKKQTARQGITKRLWGAE